MSDNRSPKLDIPSSTLRTAEENTVRATLKFDDPLEKEGEYGAYWMYSMMHEGEEHVLFAGSGLHKAIQRTGARQGDTVSIVRLGEGKSTVWDVELEGESKASQGTPRSTTPTPAPASRPSNHTGSTRASFADERNRYLAALELAKSDIEELGLPFTVDLNAVAFTYKKMADDTGHELNVNLDQVATQEAPDGGDSESNPVNHLRDTLEKAFRVSNLNQTKWMKFLTYVEGKPVTQWSDLSMEAGKAAFSWAKQVNDGELSWSQVFEAIGPEEEREFPEEAPWDQ